MAIRTNRCWQRRTAGCTATRAPVSGTRNGSWMPAARLRGVAQRRCRGAEPPHPPPVDSIHCALVAVVTAPLVRVAPATPRSRLLVVDFRNRAFDFLPGHAVLIGAHGQADRRPYSIASSPERAGETGQLELLVSTEPDGQIGPHLPSPAVGSLIDMEGPLGTFVFPPDPAQQHLLFIGGGT